MFNVNVKHAEHIGTIHFPCTEKEMCIAMGKLMLPDELDTTQEIQSIDCEELKMLEGDLVDLDELNYLAKRLDSFTSKEMAKFNAVVSAKRMKTVEKMINLTFNMPHYTLIQDFSSMAAVGKEHFMTVNMCISSEEAKNIDFAYIGKTLIDSGDGKTTQYGILFENEDVKYEEPYDGQVFPEYVYESAFVEAGITYQGKTAYVYLPDMPTVVDKALRRLGAPSLQDCDVYLDDLHLENQGWIYKLTSIMNDEGVYAVNTVIQVLGGLQWKDKRDKLLAVAEYADVSDSASIVELAKNIDCFTYIERANNDEDIAWDWIEQYEYELAPELEEFFQFEKYGEHIRREYAGKFLDSGGAVLMESKSLEEIFTPLREETDEMTMGGM